MKGTSVSILLVEDDDVDAESFQRSFKKHKIANDIVRVKDGLEALALLRKETDDQQIKTPYIIFLDINMPRMNGHEFLKELRSDESINKNVVYMLTTSEDDRDVEAAYSQCVAGYIEKSRVGEGFTNLIGLVDYYWRFIELPKDTLRN